MFFINADYGNKSLDIIGSTSVFAYEFFALAGVHQEERDSGGGFILLKHYVANDMIIFLSICYKPSIYAGCKDFSCIVFVPTLGDAGSRWTTTA